MSKLTINGTYGVTVNRGDYSSEKFSLSYGIEYDVEGDPALVAAEASAQQPVIANLVKEAVLKELGLDAKFTDDGTLVADFGTAAVAAPAPQAAPVQAAVPAQSAPSGSGGGSFGPPKISPDVINALPTITADLDGRGITTWRDLRSVKAAFGTEAGPGQYSARSVDFRDLADKNRQVWLRGKDGAIKADVVAALEAAGATV